MLYGMVNPLGKKQNVSYVVELEKALLKMYPSVASGGGNIDPLQRGWYFYEKTLLLWSFFYFGIGLFLIYLFSDFINKYPSLFIITVGVGFLSFIMSFRFFILFLELISSKYFTKNNSKNRHNNNNNHIKNKEAAIK